ncbi:MAG: phosphate acyltransferase [Roseicyclus sp.]|uniref:phosphate acyltransferase n=1 Tax=Roseicyclus sp. TaxID=1914329 RepID=UPI003A8B5BB0
MFVTDAAINIAPDLECKVSIVQNAIDLARALGVEQPKVGILSAVETVTPSIPSTLDAAILSKMAERGQITGGLVDGPLAMDNAVDAGAARTKGLTGMVAGRADILGRAEHGSGQHDRQGADIPGPCRGCGDRDGGAGAGDPDEPGR